MANDPPKQVALPPGVYTVQAGNTGKAVACPAKNDQSFELKDYSATDADQHFIINASGFIYASFNRNSLSYTKIPSGQNETVKRFTSGVPWVINVVPVSAEAEADRGWKGYVLPPGEKKNWAPNADETGIVLSATSYSDWTFKAVTNLIPGA